MTVHLGGTQITPCVSTNNTAQNNQGHILSNTTLQIYHSESKLQCYLEILKSIGEICVQ